MRLGRQGSNWRSKDDQNDAIAGRPLLPYTISYVRTSDIMTYDIIGHPDVRYRACIFNYIGMLRYCMLDARVRYCALARIQMGLQKQCNRQWNAAVHKFGYKACLMQCLMWQSHGASPRPAEAGAGAQTQPSQALPRLGS